MKIVLTFKTPDVYDQISGYLEYDDLDKNEKQDAIEEKLSKWVNYSEYVSIEFYLDNNTAEVLLCT